MTTIHVSENSTLKQGFSQFFDLLVEFGELKENPLTKGKVNSSAETSKDQKNEEAKKPAEHR